MVTYGPKLNDLLNQRRLKVLDAAYKEEEAYIQQYLKDNTNAIQTDSGLVYHETVSGSGKSPSERVQCKYTIMEHCWMELLWIRVENVESP